MSVKYLILKEKTVRTPPYSLIFGRLLPFSTDIKEESAQCENPKDFCARPLWGAWGARWHSGQKTFSHYHPEQSDCKASAKSKGFPHCSFSFFSSCLFFLIFKRPPVPPRRTNFVKPSFQLNKLFLGLRDKNLPLATFISLIPHRAKGAIFGWSLPARALFLPLTPTLSPKGRGSRGRSMIEMLGVLAIIGILSAGGVWGYNLAMENYKINKTIEDIDLMRSKAAYHFSYTPKSYFYLLRDDLRKLGIVPNDIKDGTAEFSSRIATPFSDNTYIAVANVPGHILLGSNSLKISGSPVMLFMQIYGVKSYKACVRLMTSNLNNTAIGICQKCSDVSRPVYKRVPVPIAEAESLCNKDWNSIYIKAVLNGKIED